MLGIHQEEKHSPCPHVAGCMIANIILKILHIQLRAVTGEGGELCVLSQNSGKIVVLLGMKIHFKIAIYFLTIQQLAPCLFFHNFSGRIETLGCITLSTPNCITGHKPNLKHLIHSHSSTPPRLLWLNVLSVSYVLKQWRNKQTKKTSYPGEDKFRWFLSTEARVIPKITTGDQGSKRGDT